MSGTGSDYFHVHAHSEYSWLDGMGTIEQMVARATKCNQPALALTDHGVMAGAVQLYKHCNKAGIAPFIGEEFYLVRSAEDPEERGNRYHLGMLALDQKGYEALVRLSSRSYSPERFYKKPLIDFSDLAALYESGDSQHIALTTGCFFGLPIQTLIKHGPKAATSIVETFARWFPHTFVELQNHRVSDDTHDDDEVVLAMYTIAENLGLPVVAGQDAHYCEQAHKPAHDMMKEICYFGDSDDYKFPGDSFHMATTKWVRKHYDDAVWDAVEEGHGELLDLHRLSLPELDTYKFHVPSLSKFPDERLAKAARTALADRGLDLHDRYARRLESELKTIKEMDFSNYFLLVKDVADWCSRYGVIINARGSANGSLVCYVLGITNVDPVEWDIDFTRFLSKDRMKPPDIDLDVESSQREALIDYVRSRFPTMVQIGTYAKLGINEEEDEMGGGEDKGSLFVQYMAAKRKTPGFDGKIPVEHRRLLNQLADIPVRKSAGTHAAGFVLPGAGLPIEKYLPTMTVGQKRTTVTQMPMQDVEDAGYVKLDLLGLRFLATINQTLVRIGREPNDFEWIPWDDRKACTVLRSGKTAGIFQFEGYTTMKGAQQMKVASTLDAIYCLALYRPAMMSSGMTDQFLENRAAGDTPKIHPVIDVVLDKTYGVPVFQDQVIDMTRAVGLPFEDLNAIIKAVKASNEYVNAAAEVFRKTRPKYINLCVRAGMTKAEAIEAWRIIESFSDYGFNKAHATSYGQMAYRGAYLKAHYPLEFMTSLLATWAGTKKEPVYIAEARRLGFQIVKPDVNHSDVLWTLDRKRSKTKGSIRKGLLSINGVGEAAALCIAQEREANGPYESVDDFVERLPGRPVSGGKAWKKDGEPNGVMRTLANAGALRSLGVDRFD